ncbi:MAG: DJ-1/PfpI family protein, partial [Nanoarchaeota archaeon]|nr:DJ-1/PfpI family protein [Nanoarchaeota archaeon]
YMVKILMLIAPNNFRDEEYFKPKRILETEGFQVYTASRGVMEARSKLGNLVKIDIDIYNVNLNNFDVLVLVGGNGCLIYEKDQFILNLIRTAFSTGKIIASICISPRILGASGILKGKKITMWNEDGSQDRFIHSWGAEFTDADVEIDDKLITAKGPEFSKEFGMEIAEVINMQNEKIDENEEE